MVEVSLIIPAYNEERIIERTMDKYNQAFSKKFKDYEIIVVDDGSKDKTSEVVLRYNEKDRRVKLLRLGKNIGKGFAVIEGFKNSKGKKLGFVDADYAFDSIYVVDLINQLNDYDAVIASKWKDQKFFEVREDFLRKFLSRGWNFLVYLLLGLRFKDTQAGAKFLRKEAFDKIKDERFICSGFEFDVEFLLKLKRENLRFKEVFVPIRQDGRETSKFKKRLIFQMFKRLVTLWRLGLK